MRVFGGVQEVTLNGQAVDIRQEDGFGVFDVPADLHAAGKLVYHITQ